MKKAVNADWTKTHPAAAKMFKKLSFSTGQIGAMAALVDVDKMTHEDAGKNGWPTIRVFGKLGLNKDKS